MLNAGLTLLAFILPLGLDSFAVAASLGVAGARGWARIRISVTFVVFEAGMPLVGVAIGAPLANRLGSIADFVAVGALLALGGWMLLPRREDDERRASRMVSARGLTLVALGLSVSMDELAIGFTIGLARIPVLAVVVGVAVQAFVAAQLGLALGKRVGERVRQGAERLAGLVLIGLGLFLLTQRLLHLSA
jgi:putative Mn2+ efflux pump MntP